MSIISKLDLNRKFFTTVIIFLLSLLISYILVDSAGIKYSYYDLIILSSIILIISSFSFLFWTVGLIFFLTYTLYIPIGLNFGMINSEMVLAVVTSNMGEAGEFTSLIEISDVLKTILVLCMFYIVRSIIKKNRIILFQSKVLIISSSTVLYFFPTVLLLHYRAYQSIISVRNEYIEMEKYIENSAWGESILESSDYDTFVLVIGESARRDYHHAYGYSIENTPFMSNANGLLITGLESAGATSVPSLTAMLTLSDKVSRKGNYSLNVVDLVKSVQYETFWLSNSGHLGEHDTPISALAKSSDHIFYLKKGNYDSTNTSDFELLGEFKKALDDNRYDKKFIVLHLIGSHYNACDRIRDINLISSVQDKNLSYMNCYVNSIYKTDLFLEKVYTDLLKQHKVFNNSFSLLYFSDHGLVHRQFTDVIGFANYPQTSKYHYDVPLFKVSSDDTQRKECVSFKSGLNFTNGLASWMGIKNSLLDETYDLFDCKDDKDDFGLSVLIMNGIDDPAIDIKK